MRDRAWTLILWDIGKSELANGSRSLCFVDGHQFLPYVRVNLQKMSRSQISIETPLE